MIEFGVLGPITVRRDGVVETLPVGMPTRLLAALISRLGEPISADALAHAMWDGKPPPSARKTLQVYVHRIRRALGDDALIEHGPGGYTLVSDRFDHATFAELAAAAGTAAGQGMLDRAQDLYARALKVWRGPAYADLAGFAIVARHAQTLDEQRLSVFERYMAVRLELGRHAELITDLMALAAANPYREGLHGQLMLALYRCGRQADALESYRQIHKRLSADLALDPGPALQDLHMRILRNDPSLMPQNLRYLPRDVPGFTCRASELALLDTLAGSSQDSAGAILVTAITGAGGVGKTALSVHWAHRAARRYPDGQLYINLRGYDAHAPMQPLEALGQMLRLLGTPQERVPFNVDEAAAAYRSALDGRRILVLLDNASSAEQVRQLLPPSPGSLALITSRNRLAGLVARDGARRLALDVLDPIDSIHLLRTVLGEERIAAESQAAQELAKACGHLPLALRIAAADLADQPQRSLSSYVAQLTSGDRLSKLQFEDDPHGAVRVVFEQSYASLNGSEQRAFRQLGLAAALDYVSADAASAMLDVDVALLQRLCDANLLGEPATGRFVMHDLLKEYAAERASTIDSPQLRREAVVRLTTWYLDHADTACRIIEPCMTRLNAARPQVSMFTDRASAFNWLNAERNNLIAIVRVAAEYALPEAGMLVDYLQPFLFARAPNDLVTAVDLALAAIEPLGEAKAIVSLLVSKASGLSAMDRPLESIVLLDRAAELNKQSGWPDGNYIIYGQLSAAHLYAGHLEDGYRYAKLVFQESLEHGSVRSQAIGLGRMGTTALIQGKLLLAWEHLDQSYPLFEQSDRQTQGVALANLAEVNRLLGRFDSAEQQLRQVIVIADEVNLPRTHGVANAGLSAIYLHRGDFTAAIEYAERGLAALEGISEFKIRAQAQYALANAVLSAGRPQEALALFEENITVSHGVGLKYSEVEARMGMAEALHRLDRTDEAFAAAYLAHETAVSGGMLVLTGQVRTILAEMHLALGSDMDAAREANSALEVLADTGHEPGEARARRVLSRLQ